MSNGQWVFVLVWLFFLLCVSIMMMGVHIIFKQNAKQPDEHAEADLHENLRHPSS